MGGFFQPKGLPPLPVVLRENRSPWGWAKTVRQVWQGNPGRYHAGMLHHRDAVEWETPAHTWLEQRDRRRGARPF